jgi:hypothetical protein
VPFALADLRLDPEADYHAYEFWEERYAGRVRARFTPPAQPPHSARVWVLRPARPDL